MGTVVNVLVTGVGAPGTMGTLYSLRKNPLHLKFKITGTDVDSDAVGKHFVDSFFTLPTPDNEELYIGKIVDICENKSIQFILPQTTKEIEVLSKYKEDLKNEGIKVLVADYNSLSLSNNKCDLLQICERHGIPYPRYKKVYYVDDLINTILDFGYPERDVVIKPCFSNGLRGVRIITTKYLSGSFFFEKKPNGLFITLEELSRIFSEGAKLPKPLVVQEYLSGEEYTVDVFSWNDFNVVIPRKRLKIRSGISFESVIEYHQEIIDISRKLSKILGLKYCFGFQFKLDEREIPKILESNPRVQGTMVASTFAGFNMIFLSILIEFDEKKALDLIRKLLPKIKWGTKFKRYWGGIGIDATGTYLDRI